MNLFDICKMYHKKRDCEIIIACRNINNLTFIDEAALIARNKENLRSFMLM